MNKYSGVYVFEGIDNVGKTTLIHKLKEKISAETDYNCEIVTFPGNEPHTLGNLVYDIHHNQDKYFSENLNDTSLQLLHIASHIDLINRKIKVACEKECIVLLDRCWWSTYAYGLANGISQDILKLVIKPELAYWEGVNVNKFFLIQRKNREMDYCEVKEKAIIETYNELAKKDSKCTVVNNDGTIDDVTNKIFDCMFGV